ncbi:hypothetical protein, partial [Clostridium sp.]|uniref:hypothetical protein n=1 Tax=Clostridium sp. TaxID=1506 RepID=UPI00284CB05A
ETMPVYVNKQLSLNQMLDGAQKLLGDKYFKYDAFGENNCQVFVRALLHSAGLYKAKEESFVFQPVDKILEKMGAHVPKVARVVTDLGAIADRVLGGNLDKANDFNELTVTNLRNIVRQYNIYDKIIGYSTLKKPDLIKEIHKHLKIENGLIMSRQEQFKVEIPNVKQLSKKSSKNNVKHELSQFPSKQPHELTNLEKLKELKYDVNIIHRCSAYINEFIKRFPEWKPKTIESARNMNEILEKDVDEYKNKINQYIDIIANLNSSTFTKLQQEKYKKLSIEANEVSKKVNGINLKSYLAPTDKKGLEEWLTKNKDRFNIYGGGKLTLHRVNVKSTVPYAEAMKHAQHIIKTRRKFKEKVVGKSFHFKAKPKTHFKKGSFV